MIPTKFDSVALPKNVWSEIKDRVSGSFKNMKPWNHGGRTIKVDMEVTKDFLRIV